MTLTTSKPVTTAAWPAVGYTMSGKEIEALCEAAGWRFKSFAGLCGVTGQHVRSLRASSRVEMADDLFACSAIDQMRTRAARLRAAGGGNA